MVVRYGYQRCIRCASTIADVVLECAAYRPKRIVAMPVVNQVHKHRSVEERLDSVEDLLKELLSRFDR